MSMLLKKQRIPLTHVTKTELSLPGIYIKPLLKISLSLIFFFILIFIIGKSSNLINIDFIKTSLESLKGSSALLISVIIILLLFLDIFISVPTMILCALAGHLLGFQLGFIASFLGLSLAALTGYFLSYSWGEKLLNSIIKDDKDKRELKITFKKHAFLMILLSRAVPLIPEVSICLSGITKTKPQIFLPPWIISTISYSLVTSYSGSIASIEDPGRGVIFIFGNFLILFIGWIYFFKFSKRS